MDLTQSQPGDLYQLPVEIGITPRSGSTRVERVDIDARSGHYVFPANEEPAAVVLDPNVRLLVEGRLEQRR